MSEDNNGWIVNDDELKFLSEITLNIEESDHDSNQLEYDINARDNKDRLLFQLERADALQLFADYGNHRLVFPLQLNRGDFVNFSTALQSPKIFEKGACLRAWRLLVDEAICLVDLQGEILSYQIRDISASGLSLSVDDEQFEPLPEQLQGVFLQLPSGERLAIAAQKIRYVDNRTVAYALDNALDDVTLTALAEYLFACHAQQYPQFYENNNGLMFI